MQILKPLNQRDDRSNLHQQGQALVEAALIIPMLLTILLSIFMMGIWINFQYILNNTASQAVTEIALRGRLCDANKTIKDASEKSTGKLPGIEGGFQQPIITTPLPKQGNPVTVEISYLIPIKTPLISFFDNIEITGSYTTTMQTEPETIPDNDPNKPCPTQ